MNIGIIGAGRVGTSIGKYLIDNQIHVVGYYDTCTECSIDSAKFTNTDSFSSLEELVNLSDTLFITTPDGYISEAWDHIREMSIDNKIICHFSGSLSSVVFSGIDKTGASYCSIHPMLAFSNKYSSYKQLNNTFFTIEGDILAVEQIEKMFESLGNVLCKIDGHKKAIYHTAASILSNQVVAVLATGFDLLEECGFSREDAIKASSQLIRENVENVLSMGPVDALTGPIERGDVGTVKKHLDNVNDDNKVMYKTLGKKLVSIAREKNPDRDYEDMSILLK